MYIGYWTKNKCNTMITMLKLNCKLTLLTHHYVISLRYLNMDCFSYRYQIRDYEWLEHINVISVDRYSLSRLGREMLSAMRSSSGTQSHVTQGVRDLHESEAYMSHVTHLTIRWIVLFKLHILC